jgi:hypothetical protein
MSSSPHVLYVELHVPNAKTEQEFLRHAVQAAVIKYRALHHKDFSPPQTARNDTIALPQNVG